MRSAGSFRANARAPRKTPPPFACACARPRKNVMMPTHGSRATGLEDEEKGRVRVRVRARKGRENDEEDLFPAPPSVGRTDDNDAGESSSSPPTPPVPPGDGDNDDHDDDDECDAGKKAERLIRGLGAGVLLLGAGAGFWVTFRGWREHLIAVILSSSGGNGDAYEEAHRRRRAWLLACLRATEL